MAIPLTAVANGIGKALDLAKTSSESSAKNKTDVKKYQETPMEIQKTEGDLGYDDLKPEQKETEGQKVENDGENPLPSEVADVEQSERPKLPEDETTARQFGLPDDFFTNFSKKGEMASESSPLSLGSILETGKNFGANPVEYKNSGSDSVFSGGSPIQGTASIGSSDDGAPASPIATPTPTSPTEEVKEGGESKESLLDMAKGAYESGKDIDEKELPYVESEQAAEDVEDLVQDESLSDEEKEKKLEEAVENEKDGQLDEGDLNEEKENPVDKAKSLVDKALPYLKHDSSSSASSSTGGGSVAKDAMNISSGELGSVSEAINDIIGKSAGAPSETSGIADVTQSDPTNGFGERVGSHNIGGAESVKGASKAMGNELESNVSGGSSSSAGGSVAKQFSDIINGKGIDYKASSDGGSSAYENAFDKGSIGSVKVEDALKDGRILYNGGNNIGSNGSAPTSAFNMVRKEIHDEYKNWKKRDGIYYKDKGSVAIYTTDGNDIKVKLGTRRLVDLEAVPTKALGIVEEIL